MKYDVSLILTLGGRIDTTGDSSFDCSSDTPGAKRKVWYALRPSSNSAGGENGGGTRTDYYRTKAGLPRKRPGRKPDPLILRATQIYAGLREQGKRGMDGVWHQVAARVYSNYATLPIDAQRLLRFTLRAGVYSMRYEAAARERLRTKRPQENQTPPSDWVGNDQMISRPHGHKDSDGKSGHRPCRLG